MSETTGESTQPAASSSTPFVSTRWTVVLTAAEPESPDAQEAFGSMYRDYWPPLYAYVRRRGYEPAAAEDITQDFFVTLLEKQRLNGLTREGGKFRSFLLTALKNHLANEWDRSRAALGRSRLGGDALPPPPHLVIPQPYRKTLALLFLRAARTTIPALWHGCRLLLQPRRLHELRRQQLEVRHQLRLLANEYAKLHAREEIFGRG